MAAGSKRSAPTDLDSPTELRAPIRPRRSAPARAANDPRPPAAGTSSSTGASGALAYHNGEHAASSLEKWAVILEGRIQRGDGEVVMTTQEAQELCSDMMRTVESFLEVPASRSDVINLINQVSRMSESLSHSTARPAIPPFAPSPVFSSTSRDFTPPRRPRAAFADLPFDILRLILLELRAMAASEGPDDGSYSARHGLWLFWRLLPRLAALSTSLKEACTSLYHAELVVIDIKQIPERAKYYADRPRRAAALQTMTLRTFDFEYALGRSSEDAGFLLPDLISAAPNLKELVLSGERESSFGSSERFSRARRSSFETLTGGVSVPATIVTSLASSLRTLVYGAPCSLADVVSFACNLTALERLDVLGEVDHTARDMAFKTVTRSLRRLWLPSTALGAAELGALLAADEVLDDPTAERDVRIESLAFTFDPEQFFAPVPPPPHVVDEEIGFLVSLFGVIGGDLRELAVSTPVADAPDGGLGRIRIGGGGGGGPGGGGGWMQQGQGLVVILGGGPAGGGAPGAAAGGAPGPAAGAGAQQGGAAQGAQPAPAPAA
ncbi:hypothetical protein JCM3775_001605, partial [Rhodotorula graminis]